MPTAPSRLVEIAVRRLAKLAVSVSSAHMARATGDTADALRPLDGGADLLQQLRAGLVAAANETPQIKVALSLQIAVDVLNKDLMARRRVGRREGKLRQEPWS